MEWILFGLFLVFVIGRMAGGAGKGKDDFAGNSITSYFLLEEFIDKPASEDDTPDQAERFQEQEEEDWFENSGYS